MRDFDGINPGGIERGGDGADMIEAVHVADGVHALKESHRRVYSTSADHVEATEETTRGAAAAFDLQMSALVQQRDGIESILSSDFSVMACSSSVKTMKFQ